MHNSQGSKPCKVTNFKTITMNKNIYRIIDKNDKIKYTGSKIGSWFTLKIAKSKVNKNLGETIYKYSDDFSRRLFEIL